MGYFPKVLNGTGHSVSENFHIFRDCLLISYMKDIESLLDLPYTCLRWIEADSFLFQNEVQITFEKGFYAGCYPVTQELYQKVTGENPSYFKGKHRPVEYVSWDDAQTFLQKLNQQIYLDDGLQFRLPSEAMWEYAARAKQDFEYSGSQKLHEVGWFDKNANAQTMPLGLKEPNAFDLYDMTGNVWEWCEDDWQQNVLKHPPNGKPYKEKKGDFLVVRGASWSNYEDSARLLVRDGDLHSNWYLNFGFRVFRY